MSTTKITPRQARKLRRMVRETEPALHTEFKTERRKQRAEKTKQLVSHVDLSRKIWLGMRKAKGLSEGTFPGAFSASPRTSIKWSERQWKAKNKQTTRTISRKCRL